MRYYGAWAERGPRGAFFFFGGREKERKKKKLFFFAFFRPRANGKKNSKNFSPGGLLMHVQLERCGASLAARAAVIGGGGAGANGGSSIGGGGRRGGNNGGGSSSNNSHALTPLREEELVSAGAQVASALAHLHARGISHMDVKPDNIFCALAADGCSVEMLGGGDRRSNNDDDFDTSSSAAASASARDPDGLDEDDCADARASGATVAVKLGDFGLATPMNSAAALSPDEGDCRYLAPELLEASPSGSNKAARIDLAAADAFALGASLYELASGAPLPSGGPLWHNLRSGRLALLPATSASFQRLLRSLMHPDPAKRPTMEASLSSGPFATAMAKIKGVAAVRKAAAPVAAAVALSKPKTSIMPPPPPRQPQQQLATAKSNVGSAGASRFGALSFKPSTAATGSGGGAGMPR